jgi:Mycothiol maleylpyruvate isomerase N-terminal domain
MTEPVAGQPADRHRQIGGLFTERVRGTRSWDAPSPVAGWSARDVVRHLTEWLPGFLAAGAGIELPRGPSVDRDPVGAWEAHCGAVQALLDDPATAEAVLANPHTGAQTRLLGFIGRDPFWTPKGRTRSSW